MKIHDPKVVIPFLGSASRTQIGWGVSPGNTVTYEIDVTDARDVAIMSTNSLEMEVIMPPDTVLRITSIKEVKTSVRGKDDRTTVDLVVTAKQVGGRFPAPPP